MAQIDWKAGWYTGFFGAPSPQRFFRSDELRLAILAVLLEQPRNGYEIIKEFESLSGGYYKMSSGTIYPTLVFMERLGLVHPLNDDGKRRFEPTKEGKALIAQEEETIHRVWARLNCYDEWSKFVGPEAAVFSEPLNRLLKAATTAVRGQDTGRMKKALEILEQAERKMAALNAEKSQKRLKLAGENACPTPDSEG